MDKKEPSIGIILENYTCNLFNLKIDIKYKDSLFRGGFYLLNQDNEEILLQIIDFSLKFNQNFFQENLNDKILNLLEKVIENNSYYLVSAKPIFVFKDNKFSNFNGAIKHNAKITIPTVQFLENLWKIFNEKKESEIEAGFLKGSGISVKIPLKKFFNRNNAVFGKTGTGKTFITRALIAQALEIKTISFLIFDMHNEYSHRIKSENSERKIQGLKELFPDSVILATLNKNDKNADIRISINLSDISVDDILSLQNELSLHNTACEAAYLLYSKYKNEWLKKLITCENIQLLAKEISAHIESVSALHRKLKRILSFDFIEIDSKDNNENSLKKILEFLIFGKTVIVQFGDFYSTLSYLLISNILTRMLHKRVFSGGIDKKNNQIVIVIEEAHKFLHPSIANQTPFGMISREMRKYGISLLIVDQRPSQIDDEVLSQISTKFILNITDEKDILAALSGAPQMQNLKKLLEENSNNQEALLISHVVPFTCIIKTLNYDFEFCKKLENRKLLKTVPEEILFF